MTTEEYSIGYQEGYQTGWNDAMDSLPAQPERIEELEAQQCKYPTCQSEEYQQLLVSQIKRELIAELSPHRPVPQFTTSVRKMWSGSEVQRWINENWNKIPD